VTRREGAYADSVREAAFEFGRRLGDEQFRRFLRKGGWRGGDVIITVNEELVDSVLSRTVGTTTPPVLVALRSPAGFAFMTLRPPSRWSALLRVVTRQPLPEPPVVPPDMTMGMLYDAMRRDALSTPQPTPWFTITALDHAVVH
jgi:hypothetical protein